MFETDARRDCVGSRDRRGILLFGAFRTPGRKDAANRTRQSDRKTRVHLTSARKAEAMADLDRRKWDRVSYGLRA